MQSVFVTDVKTFADLAAILAAIVALASCVVAVRYSHETTGTVTARVGVRCSCPGYRGSARVGLAAGNGRRGAVLSARGDWCACAA